MTKILVGEVGSYTFDASAKTVTLTGLPTLLIEQVLLITNVKDTSNQVIYQFDISPSGGTISGNVITLVFDTTSMLDTDPLQIWVDLEGSQLDPLTNVLRSFTYSKPSMDNAAVSSYGLPKFAFERILKQYKFTDSLLQISFIQGITGIGTVTTTDPFSLDISTGAQASSGAVLTTKQSHKHPVGKGLLFKAFVTFIGATATDNHRSFGLFNDNNGFFLRLDGSTLEFVTRKATVDTVIDITSVAIIDDKSHIWDIQLQGSGVGNIFIYQDGLLIYTVTNLGVVTEAQTDQTDLPMRIVNQNLTNTTDVLFEVEGVSVSIEGEEAVIITDGQKDISIDSAKRLNVHSTSATLFADKFDTAIDVINRWDAALVGAATYTQPANTYTIFLNTTTGATDNVLLNCKLLNLAETTGDFSGFEVGATFNTNNPANHVKEWGYKDSVKLNGCFFRLDGGALQFILLKGGVETVTDLNQAMPNTNFHNYKIEQLGAGKITGFIDGSEVVDFSPAAISQVGSSEKQPFVSAYNTAAPASTPDPMECHWIRLTDNSGNATVVRGRDDNGIYRDVAVSSSRRLLVSQEPTVPGPGETGISDIQFNSVATVTDTFVTIPSTKVVNINSLSAGAEVGNGGSKVEVYEAPNGDATGIVFIAVLFVDGSNGQVDLNYNTTTGDGTRAVLLRRERFGGGAVEVYGAWTGTYET